MLNLPEKGFTIIIIITLLYEALQDQSTAYQFIMAQ
jgi:hypothetical protein